jgi:Na+/H+ antiporter NhaD/arsenite permease-like protein
MELLFMIGMCIVSAALIEAFYQILEIWLAARAKEGR